MAEIAVPTVGGVMDGIRNYAFGAVARVGFNVVSGFTGNGLVGGAIAAAIASSVIKGVQGDVIATILGFQAAAGFNPLGGGRSRGGGGSGIINV